MHVSHREGKMDFIPLCITSSRLCINLKFVKRPKQFKLGQKIKHLVFNYWEILSNTANQNSKTLNITPKINYLAIMNEVNAVFFRILENLENSIIKQLSG